MGAKFMIFLKCLKMLQHSTRILHLGVSKDQRGTCFGVQNHLIRIYVHGEVTNFLTTRISKSMVCLMIVGATLNPIQVLQQCAKTVHKCENKQNPTKNNFCHN